MFSSKAQTGLTGRGVRLFAATLAACAALAAPAANAADWPERPVTVIVPWGAGGGTDILTRAIMATMEKQQGQPFNVVNRTGGSGLVGHSAMANSKADGYTIGTINVDLSQLVCRGLTDLSADKFTHIAMFNAEAPAVNVNAKSEWKNIDEVIEAIKSNPPGTFTASGTGTGGIYHLSWAGFLVSQGIEPDRVTWVPSQGAGPALQDLASGSIDMSMAPISTAIQLIKSDLVKPLVVMSEGNFPLMKDVPTVEQATGKKWVSQTWRMIGTPKGLPDATRDQIQAALKQAFDSPEVVEFMSGRGFQRNWLSAEEAAAYHASEDKAICEVMDAAGFLKQ